jgi:NADPH:quinone reductase-like Zn-dependent oxidoreductase
LDADLNTCILNAAMTG